MTTTHRLTGARRADRPAGTYQVTVAGHLDDHWAAWLGGDALTRNADGSTTLTIPAVDQTQLHGVLGRIRDLGVDLLALRTQDDGPAGAPPEVTQEGAVPTATDRAPRSGPSSALRRTLLTERLTLRPATEADAQATWRYRRLDAVDHRSAGGPPSFEEYRSRFLEPSRLGATVIVELPDDSGPQVVGDFVLRLEDGLSPGEVSGLPPRPQIKEPR